MSCGLVEPKNRSGDTSVPASPPGFKLGGGLKPDGKKMVVTSQNSTVDGAENLISIKRPSPVILGFHAGSEATFASATLPDPS